MNYNKRMKRKVTRTIILMRAVSAMEIGRSHSGLLSGQVEISEYRWLSPALERDFTNNKRWNREMSKWEKTEGKERRKPNERKRNMGKQKRNEGKEMKKKKQGKRKSLKEEKMKNEEAHERRRSLTKELVFWRNRTNSPPQQKEEEVGTVKHITLKFR